jgi:hypothetical protein
VDGRTEPRKHRRPGRENQHMSTARRSNVLAFRPQPATTRSLICSIDGCDNALSPRSRLPACHLCRASIGAWSRRRPAEVVARRERLHVYDCRMAEVVSVVKPRKSAKARKS